MVDNTACVLNGVNDKVAAVSASRFEHLTEEARYESLRPVKYFDRASKTREAESKGAMLCKVERNCDSLDMVGFPLVVCSKYFMLWILGPDLVGSVPLLICGVGLRVERDFTLDFVDLAEFLD